jgi:hypothetical protein
MVAEAFEKVRRVSKHLSAVCNSCRLHLNITIHFQPAVAMTVAEAFEKIC